MVRSSGDRAGARLKRALKKTPAYRWLKSSRARRQLAQWTPHDQRKLEFYGSLIAAGDLCFDVGANMGNRVKIFTALGARVVAVEPQPDCARVLEASFGRDPRFTLVEKALGESEGQAEMMICDADAISSLSREWVAAVVESGRFADQRWDRTKTVAMTTLDRLVAEYGAPAFVKIDVEGFEYGVVKGLSKPVKALSLEFTPEFLQSTVQCLEHLEKVGEIRVNFSLEESMRFSLGEWVRPCEALDVLSEFEDDHRVYGDVYVRFVDPDSRG